MRVLKLQTYLIPSLRKIYKGKDDDYYRAADLLSEYFLPKKNIEYETHVFRQAKQMTSETIDRSVSHSFEKIGKKLRVYRR